MKKELSRVEAKLKVKKFFERESFSSEEVHKIRRLAMKHRIRLKDERKKFCKNCLSKLSGKTRVTSFYKRIECRKCGYSNKFKF